MASKIAQTPSAPSQHPESAIDTLPESTSYAEPQVNGVGESGEAAANASGFSGNASLPATDLEASSKVPPISSNPQVTSAGSAPINEVSSGIQPVADFVPKDTTMPSHPTPPPEEPQATELADLDTDMVNAGSDVPPSSSADLVTPGQSEQSLVRPREDDGDEEPAAKRTRVDHDVNAPSQEATPIIAANDDVQPSDTTSLLPGGDAPTQVDAQTNLANANPANDTNVSQSVAEDAPVQTIDASISDEPAAPAAPAEPELTSDVNMEGTEQIPVPSDASAPVAETAALEPTATETDAMSASMTEPKQAAQVESASAETTAANDDVVQARSLPMTTFQRNSLVEKMRNLKKTRHSMPFLKPVDAVALNIPTYFDVVKQPMDLGTMESKLKNNEYGSVQDFDNDFQLIIANARRFNGDAHAVTQAGFSMKAYFDKMLHTVPSADQQEPPKGLGRTFSLHEPKRREARVAAAPPPPAPAAPAPSAPLSQQQSFALQSDGVPQIRRASSNARPARAIKPPQNREIAYAKPKRKEHLLELKFAEHVLDQIRGPKYATLNSVFQLPVDPVALNIPNYHSVIKHPMDISTMVQKMKSGQYGTAGEFKKDFDLMIKNCLLFNPVGNPVRDLAIGLQREFESLWADKAKWERKNAPASTRASSASGEGESEEEEEEEEVGDNAQDATVASLKKQIALMQSTLESLAGGGAAVKGSSKPPRSHKRKHPRAAPMPPPKAGPKASKPKRERLITYEEKDEISKAVDRMDDKQIGKLTEIITRECPKYRDMEEMELEIDDLPNGVQLMLLRYVRELFGNANRKKASATRSYSPDDVAAQDDDDFEPKSRASGGGRAGGGGNKRKKHAPMSKQQQEEQLRALQGKLAEFSNAATSGSESPAAAAQQKMEPESSGDEEEEESEEE